MRMDLGNFSVDVVVEDGKYDVYIAHEGSSGSHYVVDSADRVGELLAGDIESLEEAYRETEAGDENKPDVYAYRIMTFGDKRIIDFSLNLFFNGDNNEAENGKPYQTAELSLDMPLHDFIVTRDDKEMSVYEMIDESVEYLGDYTKEEFDRQMSDTKSTNVHLQFSDLTMETPDGDYYNIRTY